MSAPLFTNSQVLLLGSESVEGTPVPIGSGNYVEVTELSFVNNQDMHQRGIVKSTWDKLIRLPKVRLATISGKCEIKSPLVADAAPHFDAIMKALSCSSTFNAGAHTYTYKPIKGGGTSCCMELYCGDGSNNAAYVKMLGCRGIGSIELNEVAIPAYLNFQLQGVVWDEGDGTLPTENLTGVVPPQWYGDGTFTFDGDDFVINKFVLNMGQTLKPRTDGNSPYGCKSIFITDWNPTGDITIEAQLEADLAVMATMNSTDTIALSSGWIGVAGNRFSITVPKMTIDDYTRTAAGATGDIVNYDIKYGATQNTTGNDSWELVVDVSGVV